MKNEINIEILKPSYWEVMDVIEILSHLKSIADPSRLNHMKRYGINTKSSLGISIYDLRRYACEIGRNHVLALDLWKTGIHDARLLACFIDDAEKITSDQMDLWADGFNSWDLCDQACTSLFDKSPLAWKKIPIWAESEKEFVKRAAFSLIAGLSIHDKESDDHRFEAFFPLIKKQAIEYAPDDDASSSSGHAPGGSSTSSTGTCSRSTPPHCWK